MISTLWAVSDIPAALLVGEFYKRHLEQGQEPAARHAGALLEHRLQTYTPQPLPS